MWQAHSELSLLAPKGFRLIQCGCDQPCPNGLARLDWIDSDNDTSLTETEEWYRGRKLISSTLATVSTLNTRSPHIQALLKNSIEAGNLGNLQFVKSYSKSVAKHGGSDQAGQWSNGMAMEREAGLTVQG